ncbi:MAG: coproporphyrinogen III oxidase [Campylobacterota bacterium]|nr:coproporphyrinogen III oxidase [Campylobacterota bacterium]
MMIKAKSPQALEADILVKYLQSYFVSKLNSLSKEFGNAKLFEEVEWMRDFGKHGGGSRFEARDDELFNRASVNVSQVHYDDNKDKKLSSATAISTIIHPQNPNVPSMHMHISWTQMRDGSGYWRIMADLNPSIKNEADKVAFDEMLKESSGVYYEEGSAQGDRYFNIPALKRTRGVSHFYLEEFNSGDFASDKAFAKKMGEDIIDSYIAIITEAIKKNPAFTSKEKEEQLAYHTLYLFQVLTLDRGTTSGLLVHDQNDVGIMGSIPSHINRELLASWVKLMSKPQDLLVESLLNAVPDEMPTPIEEATKKKLAKAVRGHYKKYPEALSMQASGETIPATVSNHT